MSAPDVPESSRARQGAEQEPQSEPRRKWVALVSIIVFPDNEDDERVQKMVVRGHDVLLDLNNLPAPAKPSHLVLHPRVAPNPRCNDRPLSAYILAADRSGLLLLQVKESNFPDLDFFFCNTHTSTVTILPKVPSDIQDFIRPFVSIGLISDPDHPDHFVVAQLQPTTSKCNDVPNGLLCYSTATRRWFTRDLTLQQGDMTKTFSETGVIPHDGRLWWIALAYGVFFCNPCTQTPQLRFLPLPPGCEMWGNDGFDLRIRTLLEQRRCVRLSKGKLRFVVIGGLSYYDVHAPAANPTVWMWTLNNPEATDPAEHWTLEYGVPFADIWGNESYAGAGLTPGEVPYVALIDPNDHRVVYFFQRSKLFSVDMREKKVVDCKGCRIHRARISYHSSRPIVDAWEVPPPRPKLSGDDESSPDDAVWSTRSYVEEQREVMRSVDSWINLDGDTDASVEKQHADAVNSGDQADDEPGIQTTPSHR